MAAFDYGKAKKLLSREFRKAENAHLDHVVPGVDAGIVEAYDKLFESKTQAFREVLLGCLIVRLLDESINVRLPYVNQGSDSYNGRTLDERVINPFLRSNRIPSTKGPFLSVFRRSVRFDEGMRDGLRDKTTFDAMLTIIEAVERSNSAGVTAMLRYHLYRFVELREESEVELIRIKRVSLEQCAATIEQLLDTPSGGRFPVFLVVATFRTMNTSFALGWTIDCQEINVSDKAAGAGGDVTIMNAQGVVLSAEITERMVDKERVVATFDTKIAPNSIDDYLFFVRDRDQAPAAIEQARRYFSQGHEVNFLEMKNWIVTMLSVVGPRGRARFQDEMAGLIDDVNVPKILKVAWNVILGNVIAGS